MDAATSGAAPSRVLVVRASGGVGSYAVQLAVAAGAHVTKAFPLARAGEAIETSRAVR
ncbi:hypothetical protein [Sinomonas gamaensis]|uniref:hypothetical protein n=1 Tax=Sinomonas gamaensis TaxID=2565624 RepID=UPI0014861835|nr:hypothetical protein [Sinomonas gamaensis]